MRRDVARRRIDGAVRGPPPRRRSGHVVHRLRDGGIDVHDVDNGRARLQRVEPDPAHHQGDGACTDIRGIGETGTQHVGRPLLRQRPLHRARRADHPVHVEQAGVGERRRRGTRRSRTDPAAAPDRRSTRAATSRTGSSCRSRRGSRWRCATPSRIRSTRARRGATPTRRTRASSRRRKLVPGGAVLSAGLGAVLRQHQLRQHALVRIAAHQRPRVHRRLRQCNLNCDGADELRVHPEGRRSDGPPSPQVANLDTLTPNSQTLLMNPGDKIRVHIFDAQLGGGGTRSKTGSTT